MDRTRVSRIQVKNLFGSINYDIKISESSNVAIITAPNGRGKTTILNLISFVLNPKYESFSAIRNTPFDTFRCILSNGRIVELTQLQNEKTDISSQRINISPSAKEQAALRVRAFLRDKDFVFSIQDNNLGKQHTIALSEAFRNAFELDTKVLLNDNEEDDEEYISLLQLRDGFPFRRSSITRARFSYVFKLLRQLLEEYNCNLPVNFIKADRIQPVIVSQRRMSDIDESYQESPLKIASERIGDYIKTATEKYNESVSKAKDELPKMFLEGKGSKLSYDKFMQGWSTYREELNQFQDIGIITQTEDFTKDKNISRVYKNKGKFLSTYLSAFKDTTAPLRNIYKRLRLFKQILDERNSITGKRVVFDRDGVSLFASNQEINLETLSSGEKHDFIMFYNLIFNISDNGLVLVDEPEISLHIEWQETYLDRLLAICAMNNLQAIVATHSPNIISSHYDLLVDKGENNGEG